MRAHMINVEYAYPENIPLIDEAFDNFDWDNYPKETLSAIEIETFFDQAVHQTGQSTPH